MASRELSPKAVRLITASLFVATFVAGTLTGAGVSRWAMHNSAPMPPGPLPFWELDPTPEQEEKMHQIMEKHRPELDLVLRDVFPKVRTINDKIEIEVREFLTEAQKQKLDKLKASRPPPPPGAPRHGRPPPNGFPPNGLPPPPPPNDMPSPSR